MWHSAEILPKDLLDELIDKEEERLAASEKEAEELKKRKNGQLREILGELTNRVDEAREANEMRRIKETYQENSAMMGSSAGIGGKVWNLLNIGIQWVIHYVVMRLI